MSEFQEMITSWWFLSWLCTLDCCIFKVGHISQFYCGWKVPLEKIFLNVHFIKLSKQDSETLRSWMNKYGYNSVLLNWVNKITSLLSWVNNIIGFVIVCFYFSNGTYQPRYSLQLSTNTCFFTLQPWLIQHETDCQEGGDKVFIFLCSFICC